MRILEHFTDSFRYLNLSYTPYVKAKQDDSHQNNKVPKFKSSFTDKLIKHPLDSCHVGLI